MINYKYSFLSHSSLGIPTTTTEDVSDRDLQLYISYRMMAQTTAEEPISPLCGFSYANEMKAAVRFPLLFL